MADSIMTSKYYMSDAPAVEIRDCHTENVNLSKTLHILLQLVISIMLTALAIPSFWSDKLSGSKIRR